MTPSANDTPEEVLKRLSSGADPRRVRSLQIVHAVCESQCQRGSQDYSLTGIGRLSQQRGGPSTVSLGNPSGRVYRLLIAAHRAAYATPRKKKRRPHADELLSGLRDPLQRARIEQLRDDVRVLRRQVIDLQRIANASSHVAMMEAGNANMGKTARFVSPPRFQLLPYERDALRCALDPRRLKRLGLVVEPQGRVETAEGHEIFPVGFATGLGKLLASDSDGTAPSVGGLTIDGPTNASP